MWVGDRVRYAYYEKPTTNPKVFPRKGAHGWRGKIATLAMEGVRRMRNLDPRTPEADRLEVIKDFALKLKDSGYDTKERREILKAGIIKYYRLTAQSIAAGKISANRTRAELAGKRTLKQLENLTWFSRNRGGKARRQEKDDPWRQQTKPKGRKGGRCLVHCRRSCRQWCRRFIQRCLARC